MPPKYKTIEQSCEALRQEVGALANSVVALKGHDEFGTLTGFSPMQGEMIANIMLAYRHLEDARMRLGKVMQAYQGGVSILDKPVEEMAKIQKRVKGE